jgi:hypothetical protein
VVLNAIQFHNLWGLLFDLDISGIWMNWILPISWSNRVSSQVLILLPERLIAKHGIGDYRSATPQLIVNKTLTGCLDF